MEFYEVVSARYSVRAFRSEPVEAEKLERILDAARLAPTAANRQAFQVIVARVSGRESELLKVYGRDWFVQAPLVIAVCTIVGKCWVRKDDNKNYADVDAAIVMDHIILAATAEQLGTCWIAAFDRSAARHAFAIPDEMEPVVLTPVGYAAGAPSVKKRKPLSELVKYI